MPRSVTVGVDGSPQSLAAADWAAREAELRGLPLRVVHAWRKPFPEPEAAEAREALEHWASRVPREAEGRIRHARPGLELSVEQIDGLPGQTLARAAADSALLVLGSQGLSGLSGYLVGSTGHLLLGEVTGTPLVFVRTGSPGARDGPVVVGVSDGADAPLDFAFDTAARRGCPLRAVHAWRIPGYYGFGMVAGDALTTDRARSEVTALRERLRPWRERHPAVDVTTRAAAGLPVDLLSDASREAALLVVGRRERRLPVGTRAGSVTYGVLHHVPVPVAVVPHG
ncbi:universal stress protein [Streptomyces sp. NPDC006798]|uniref:universal stress protein n=1 Tax=Streptomyces sp. NPDC006798 TaxID=3155462 RepID=UPI0033D33F8E